MSPGWFSFDQRPDASVHWFNKTNNLRNQKKNKQSKNKNSSSRGLALILLVLPAFRRACVILTACDFELILSSYMNGIPWDAYIKRYVIGWTREVFISHCVVKKKKKSSEGVHYFILYVQNGASKLRRARCVILCFAISLSLYKD